MHKKFSTCYKYIPPTHKTHTTNCYDWNFRSKYFDIPTENFDSSLAPACWLRPVPIKIFRYSYRQFRIKSAISAPRADTWWNQAGASHRAVGLWQFEGAVVNLQTPGPTIWRRSDEYAAVLKKDRNQWRRGIADSQLLHRQKCRG